MELLPKVYEPKSVEGKWYNFWLEKDYFHPLADESKKTFSMVIPPPNITGSLHMGHALNNTLQDVMTRFKRMQGFLSLWLPGTDHAGIATQNVVEKELLKEGISREKLGREQFLKQVWQWKEKYGNTIINQLKRLGCSCDWKRSRFTMDENYSRAVREVFVRLYKDGLIYKDKYIINWCPRCQTAISDIEVEHLETKGHLWYIKYFLKDSQEYITVATTRPETLLGDTAVSVNPDDKRYQKNVGKILLLPLLKREIPLIADDYVDMDFGTGAVKVTPAHDPNDFEIGLRHNLEKINIFTEKAVLNENAGKYKGLDRFSGRDAVVEDLKKAGLLEKIEDYMHAVGHCYRCHTIIEPYLSEQWFVKMKPLASEAIDVVKKGKIIFVPERWAKTYFEWMYNIRDWCISRQIWWGHQIPVWHCENCSQTIVSVEEPKTCDKCKNSNLRQETDVLDTWFSSALWPFATMGWPEETPDLKIFYPTSVLSTGFDIIYFWVARMIMMGLYFIKDVPFHHVYIHAIMRDVEGKKMSKSSGNIIDPSGIIDLYGADALRFTLASLAVPGRDVYLSEEKIVGNRNFANKLWNASRFVLMNLSNFNPKNIDFKDLDLNLADKWILSRYSRSCQKINFSMERYNFNEAAASLFEFIWGEFCDWYIEISKICLYGQNGISKLTVQYILWFVLDKILRMLHPFMPFITEEIWQKLPAHGESITISPYPQGEIEFISEEIENKMELVKNIITSIRQIRSELSIPPSLKLKAQFIFEDPQKQEIINDYADYILELSGLDNFSINTKIQKRQNCAKAVTDGIEIFIPLEKAIETKKGASSIEAYARIEIIDVEKRRLEKTISEIEEELNKLQTKLSNKNFLAKAPPEVVEKVKKRLKASREKKQKLESQLINLR